MCAGRHALHAILYAVLDAAMDAALYSEGRGGRASFARGASVMFYALKLRTLQAVSAGSCAPCAGGRGG